MTVDCIEYEVLAAHETFMSRCIWQAVAGLVCQPGTGIIIMLWLKWPSINNMYISIIIIIIIILSIFVYDMRRGLLEITNYSILLNNTVAEWSKERTRPYEYSESV